jgi:nucleotide-binding universal stress UspA family protein
MTYAALMVCTEPGPDTDARVALAAALADRFHALLIGFAAEEMRPLVPRPTVGAVSGAADIPEVLRAEQGRIEAALRLAEDRFRRAAGGNGRSLAWRAFAEAPTEACVAATRAADLLIMGRSLPQSGGRPECHPDPGRVLLASGRPVLLIPSGISVLAARHVLVAWRDTREARRALSDALPFLLGAGDVTVLEVCEHDDDRSAAERRVADVVAHLLRHGVSAVPKVQPLQTGSVTDEVLLAAARQEADLIVAGGYAHARLWELVWGGVTRDLLLRSPKCCLLSH